MQAPQEPRQHLVGYARVSMSDQNTQRQIDELKAFGVAESDIFQDTKSGKTMNRPGWKNLWRDVREGDLLVVHALDRLGRDMLEVMAILDELDRRKVQVKILTFGLDTRTPMGRFVLSILLSVAELERNMIVERTRHGLAKARERGRIGGRPERLSEAKVLEAIRREKAGEFLSDIAKEFGVGRNTLYKRRKDTMDAQRAKEKAK